MAIFNDDVVLANGKRKNIKIPGGSDMTIYKDGGSFATKYRLGKDGCYYNRISGSQVASKMSVPEFARLHITWNLIICQVSFFFLMIIILCDILIIININKVYEK